MEDPIESQIDPQRRYSLREVGDKGWLFGLSYDTLYTMAKDGRLKPPILVIIKGNRHTNYRIFGNVVLQLRKKGQI